MHCLLAGAVILAQCSSAWAQEPLSPEKVAFAAYQSARERYHQQQQQDSTESAWIFGRACFDWAEFATNDTQRAALALEGIGACETAVSQDDGLVGAHFYLGMNQGQLARTMHLGALKLVNQMEGHFFRARELDPEFEQAGPDRNLGLLYLQAPGWPVSVGNRSKARAHLSKAAELAPLFPENRLNLIEAYDQWNERTQAHRELKAWEKVLTEAREQFSGERWQSRWQEWNQRLKVLQERLAKAPPDLRSPKARG